MFAALGTHGDSAIAAARSIGGTAFVANEGQREPPFTSLVLGGTAATLDFSSWSEGLVLLPMGLLLELACYGAATALAGNSIPGHPLEDAAKR